MAALPNFAPGTLASRYKELVEEYGMMPTPTILVALNKIDEKGGPSKNKALAEVAVAAIKKWEATFIVDSKKVTNFKEKTARLAFALEVKGMKEMLRGESPNGSTKPAKPEPYKKTVFGSEYMKARAQVPLGAVAVALWDLDNAATLEDAKLLAQAAQKVLEKDLAELDADVKAIKDEDRKAKVKGFRNAVGQLLDKVKAVAK